MVVKSSGPVFRTSFNSESLYDLEQVLYISIDFLPLINIVRIKITVFTVYDFF